MFSLKSISRKPLTWTKELLHLHHTKQSVKSVIALSPSGASSRRLGPRVPAPAESQDDPGLGCTVYPYHPNVYRVTGMTSYDLGQWASDSRASTLLWCGNHDCLPVRPLRFEVLMTTDDFGKHRCVGRGKNSSFEYFGIDFWVGCVSKVFITRGWFYQNN